MGKLKKICAHCGKEFETSSKKQKFCTKKCLEKHYNALRYPSKTYKKKCAKCGREFKTTRTLKKYCSKECAGTRPKLTEKKAPVKPLQRRCKFCDAPISAKYKLCDACRQELANRIIMRLQERHIPEVMI